VFVVNVNGINNVNVNNKFNLLNGLYYVKVYLPNQVLELNVESRRFSNFNYIF